ncbi:MAG: hydrolase [Thiolinea sp.]
MGKINNSNFRPAWWLRSKHLQTIWPSLLRKRPDFQPEWERVELADGDFIDLAWHQPLIANAPVVMLIHGLEGSLESHYAGNLLVALHQAGFRAVLMHLRGRGREPNRIAQSYHSGASNDLRLILKHLQQQELLPHAVIGVSLGGNLLLKYLGEEKANSPLQKAIAISVPFSLQACADRLEQGFSRIYGNYLLNLLKKSYHSKFSRIPSPLNLDQNLSHIKTLRQFDDLITAPLHDFNGAADYYERCSCAQFLPDIHTPTLILHSADDPFMTADVIPSSVDMSDAVTLELSRNGGHVGFIAQRPVWGLEYWLEKRVIQFLRN